MSATKSLDQLRREYLEKVLADLIAPQGGLTNTQLRATPVSTALDAATLAALETINVLGPLTDTQLRALPLVIRDEIAFYASALGGTKAFNITTQIVNFTTTGEQNLAALMNPTGSGVDMYLDVGEFGSSVNTTFRRYRNSTITPITGAVFNSGSNMGGGSNTSAAQMYVGGTTGAQFTRSGGVVSKTAHIAAFDQYLTSLKGKVRVRPGQSLSWTISPGTNVTVANPMTASIFFEYYEMAAT